MSNEHEQAAEIAASFLDRLRRNGSLRVPYQTDAERDLYREAGCHAEKLLLQRVRTADIGGAVIIELPDWAHDHPLPARLTELRANKKIDRALGEQ